MEQSHSAGKLISLEGIEGAGKTTHLKAVQDFLTTRGLSAVITREPGATALGKEIRVLLLSSDYQIDAYAELALLFADRADHIEKIIRPALAAGQWVISDRFSDASFAYQGAGRGVPDELIQRLIHHICGEIQPVLTLLLDVDYATAMARVELRDKKDRFESENAEFFNRVKRRYLELAQQQPQRWRVVDADASPDKVEAAIRETLAAWFSNSGPD